MICTNLSLEEPAVEIEPTTVTGEKSLFESIPNEILAIIFIGCVDDDPQLNLQPDVTIAPLLLCRICSLWRKIAFNLPRLWESLHLDLGHAKLPLSPLSGLLKEKVDILEFWTSKAAPLHPSLHLSFNDLDNVWSVEEHDFVPFERLFSFPSIPSARLLDLNHLTHWNVDTLFNPVSDYVRDYTTKPEAYDFPNLEVLAFRSGPVNPFLPTGDNLMMFERTPSLRRLAVYLLRFPLVPFGGLLFSWENLTHCLLACHQVSFPRWYGILTSCINLVCGVFLVDMQHFIRHEPTELPNLRQLTVVCVGETPEGIFRDLSFPSLTALRLSIVNHSSLLEMQNLLIPMPSLVEFHLQSCIAVADTSDPLSMFVPNLRIMVIDGFIFCGSISPLDDINKLLCQPWLTNGWQADRGHRERIEYIVYPTLTKWKGLTQDLIRRCVAQHIASLPKYPFASVVIHDRSEILWDWPIMTAYDLEHRWDQKMKFYERS